MFVEVLCTPTTPTCRTLEHRNFLTHELAQFIARWVGAKYVGLMNGNNLYLSFVEIDFARYAPTAYTGVLKTCEGVLFKLTLTQTCGGLRVFEVYRVIPKE